MNKFFFTISFLIASISINAQKSYVNVLALNLQNYKNLHEIYLSGDVPSGVENYYDDRSIGDVLNELAKNGYEVELMCNTSTVYDDRYSGGYKRGVNYLLSKKTVPPVNAIYGVQSDDNVTEVARYNLQGLPVKKTEKGIQIIVFSNFTTKTIMVQ